VSAFHVSNRKDGFCITGSILARSKFYGKAISLDNIVALGLVCLVCFSITPECVESEEQRNASEIYHQDTLIPCLGSPAFSQFPPFQWEITLIFKTKIR